MRNYGCVLGLLACGLAAQDPSLDAAKLAEIRMIVATIEDGDLHRSAAAVRALEDLLNGLGAEAPDYLQQVTPASESLKDRFETLRRTLERYFADPQLFGIFESFGARSVAGLPRIRLQSAEWPDGEGGTYPVHGRNAWLIGEDGEHVTCLDDDGFEIRLARAPGPRTDFVDPDRQASPETPAPEAAEVRPAGAVYDLISFRDEVAAVLGRESATWDDPQYAWWCHERGLHVQSAVLAARWARAFPDGTEQLRGSLVGGLRGVAFRRLSLGAPRTEVAAILDRVLPLASDDEAPGYRELAAALRTMAAEDAAHVVPPEDATPEERIRHLVFELRNVNVIPMSDPSMFSVFSPLGGPDHAGFALCDLGLPAVPALIAVLDDPRPTRSYDWWRSFTPGSYRLVSIGTVAEAVLEEMLHRRMSKAEWERWWRENGAKTATDLVIEDLRSPDPGTALMAIRRIPPQDLAAHEVDILAALDRMKRSGNLALAIQELPPGFVNDHAAVFLPFLEAPEPFLRLTVAMRIVDSDRRRAIDSVRDLVRAGVDDDGRLESMVEWLLETGDEAARETVFHLLRSGATRAARKAALEEIADANPPGALQALLGAFGDQAAQNASGSRNGVEYVNPRIADLAGMAASRILGREKEFSWVTSRFQRDRHLDRLRKAIVAKLIGAPVETDDPGQISADGIRRLIPGLTSDDAGTREASLHALAALGTGAWAPLAREASAAEGVTRRWLESAQRHLAIWVRYVASQGQVDVGSFKDRPLDFSELRRRIIEPFAEDHGQVRLRIEIGVAPGGGGVDIAVEISRDPARAGPAGSISYWRYGSAGMSNEGEAGIAGLWEEVALELELGLQSAPGIPAYEDLVIEKRW